VLIDPNPGLWLNELFCFDEDDDIEVCLTGLRFSTFRRFQPLFTRRASSIAHADLASEMGDQGDSTVVSHVAGYTF
jgi:hypothetical protein